MSSIAQIPLQVQTPQPTQPLQSIGALMALRGQINENALRQAQIPLYQAQAQNMQAEAAQRQRAVADQQTLQQLIQSDPANAQAYGRGDLSFADGKISPLFQSQVQQQRTQSLLEQAKVPAAQMQNQKDAAAELLQHIDSLRPLSPGDRAQQIGSVLNSLSPAVKQAFPQISQLDPTKMDLSDHGLDSAEAGLGILEGHLQQSLANQKTQSETAKATAEAQQAGASAALTQQKVNAAKALTPETIQSMVDGRIDKTKYPQQNQEAANAAQDALRMGLGGEGANAAIKDVQDKIAQRENTIATAQVTSMPFRQIAADQANARMLDQSYARSSAEIDKLQQPALQSLQQSQAVHDALSLHTPSGDATAEARLMSLATGQVGGGSGAREQFEEIAKNMGTHWQNIAEALNKWSTDPNKGVMPDSLRNQVAALSEQTAQRSQDQWNITQTARRNLAAAPGPEVHRAIVADTYDKLGQAAIQPGASGKISVTLGGKTHTFATQAQADAYKKAAAAAGVTQ